MTSHRFLFAAATASILSACGGKVIFDTASAGNGGASSATSGTVFGPQSTAVTSTHATSVVSTTNVGTTNKSSSIVGTGSNVSSGDVMPSCDTGQPGMPNDPVCGSCVMCATTTVCAAQFQAFQQSADGQAFSNCYNACMPQTQQCLQQCEAQHPQGAPIYFAAVACVFCGACSVNCGIPPQSPFCMMTGG